MNLEPTAFRDLFVLTPRPLFDERGYFMESYNARTFRELGLEMVFVQDNQSRSSRGVLRGMHYQNAPFAQTKLVRVLSGTIWDVAIDLRRDQPTFGQYFGIELSAENRKQLLVPKGFAHGFLVLSEEADVLYKCDTHYHPESEGGIVYNDPAIEIDWKLDPQMFVVSAKDKQYPSMANAEFTFE
ncbi:MAG: dTDP-4-dehydrorhamnose 3,5-epimerase [Cyclobacteriaceae bacterium]|jgi:dTDP-4-dehydrorhamnose 3,5-epimerase|nr:dTDP-4-dehydrorhamnose 3,5-epimerase [Cyclobacteriaceae bacterium]